MSVCFKSTIDVYDIAMDISFLLCLAYIRPSFQAWPVLVPPGIEFAARWAFQYEFIELKYSA